MNPIVTVRWVHWNALFKHIIPLDILSKQQYNRILTAYELMEGIKGSGDQIIELF